MRYSSVPDVLTTASEEAQLIQQPQCLPTAKARIIQRCMVPMHEVVDVVYDNVSKSAFSNDIFCS